jgi:hypothetical protein
MYDELGRSFEVFAMEECRDYGAPLYERLALGVAADPDLLALTVSTRPGQPAPNLLFAAVQLLLLQGIAHPLARYYPALGGDASQPGDPLPLFHEFCLEHRDSIRQTVETRIVQTNIVERSLCLYPAFGLVAERAGGKPLALIEVGASAGLNIAWDRFGYAYGGRRAGMLQSPVQLACPQRGDNAVPLPNDTPAVTWRVGLDLNPLDVRDDEAALWLRALTWPDHPARAANLERAILLAREEPPQLVAGDALDLLPALLAAAPKDAQLCVCHTMVLHQFSREGRRRFAELLDEGGSRWPLYEVALGPRHDGQIPLLQLVEHAGEASRTTTLARFHAHGAWIDWVDAELE